MKPLEDRALEGRSNPKGIPCLYLATNQETALSETRPWMGSLISIGQFKTMRGLSVINCTSDRGPRFFWGEEPPADEREDEVWAEIDRAFALPITPSDDAAAYAPTQILAELFKANGYDGIAYRSSLGPGHNVAIFDLGDAELVNCSLFEARRISFKFSAIGNPYYVTRHFG
jgi:hypothetical protein